MSNQERTRAPYQATRGGDDITSALRDAKANFDEAVADAGERGKEALQSARDVRDTFADAVLSSIKSNPYTTLAVVGFIGFLFGATRRR